MTRARTSFIPEAGERALIVGQTGSGKTAFATWLLERIPTSPIVIYDTKEEEKFPALPNSRLVHNQTDCDEAINDLTVDYVIFRPPVDQQGNPEILDGYLWHHYQHYKGIVAYIDEGGTFHRNTRAFKGLIALMARGRSRGITTILSTQRPVGISRSIISEAQKVYAFKLGDRRDRKVLSEVVPNFDHLPLPPKHGFYFFESGQDAAALFEPITLPAKYETGYVDASQVDHGAETTAHPGDAEPALTKHIWI